jgi:4-hydroxy-tetrahydrodipicolinate reductase
MKSPSQKKSKSKSILIFGLSGRMGQEIAAHAEASSDFQIVTLSNELKPTQNELNSADIIIDFSSREGNQALLKLCSRVEKKCVLIGTTGLTDKDFTGWQNLAKKNRLTVLAAPNTSVGIRTFASVLNQISSSMVKNDFEVEITETHHSKKKDAPSGTALFLAKIIQKACPHLKITDHHEGLRKKNTIGIHAIRGGGVYGEHTVRFLGSSEELSVSHRAYSRSLFAQGTLALAREILRSSGPGFFQLEDLLLR